MITLITQEHVDKVLKFAAEAHEGQLRKNSGLPYISHPIEVAEIAVRNINTKDEHTLNTVRIISLLHDVEEDTARSLADIYAFLISIEIPMSIATYITARVRDLSRDKKKMDVLTYLRIVKANFWSKAVKLADLEHNLSDLGPGNLRDKYLLSKWFLEN